MKTIKDLQRKLLRNTNKALLILVEKWEELKNLEELLKNWFKILNLRVKKFELF